jgi:small subunit ribosomal protein S20
MAITSSAKKAHRQGLRKKVFNDRRATVLKKTLKSLGENIVTKAAQEAQAGLKLAYKALDKAAKRGVIKKGTADRKKSRLSKAVAKIQK